MSDRVLVKLVNREDPLVFGVTATKLRNDGLLEITLWEPANEFIVRTVEFAPHGWEWYEIQKGDPPTAEPRVLNPSLAPDIVHPANPKADPRIGPGSTYGLLSGQEDKPEARPDPGAGRP